MKFGRIPPATSSTFTPQARRPLWPAPGRPAWIWTGYRARGCTRCQAVIADRSASELYDFELLHSLCEEVP